MPPRTPDDASEELLRKRGTLPENRLAGPANRGVGSTLAQAGGLPTSGPVVPAAPKGPKTTARPATAPRRILLVPQAGARIRGETLKRTAAAVQGVIRDQSDIGVSVGVATPAGAAAKNVDAVRVNVVNPADTAAIDRILTRFGVVPDDPARGETSRAEIKAALKQGIGVTLPDETAPHRSLIIVPDLPLTKPETALTPRHEATLILHELSEAGGGEPPQETAHRLVVDSKGTLPRLGTDEKAALRRLLLPQGAQP